MRAESLVIRMKAGYTHATARTRYVFFVSDSYLYVVDEYILCHMHAVKWKASL